MWRFLSLLIRGSLGGFQAYLLILSHQQPLPYFILSTLHGKVVQCVPFRFTACPYGHNGQLHGVLCPPIWFGFARICACMTTSPRRRPVALNTPACWRCLSLLPDSGSSMIWPRQAAYLCSHLNALQRSLAEKGIPLIYKEVSDFTAQLSAVQEVCQQNDVTHLLQLPVRIQ